MPYLGINTIAMSRTNPLASLEDPSLLVSDDSAQWPSDIIPLDHWVRFTAVKRNRPWRNSSNITEGLFSIFLPIPDQLNTSYSSSYEMTDMGALGAIGANVTSGVKNLAERFVGGESIANIVDSLKASSSKEGEAIGKKMINKVGAAAANWGAQNTEALGFGGVIKPIELGIGKSTNPHKAVLFTGTDFRKHSFNYNLIARNLDESNAIRKIIYRFKYHAAPAMVLEEEFFDYPDEFDIAFNNDAYLFSIAPSVLTQIGVQYHGQGAPAYFRDSKAPVSVLLSLEFTELTITTKETIEKGLGQTGVGR